MAPDDPASVTLAAIARKLDFMRPDIEEPGSSPAARLIAGHAALLLAAVEAVLKLADEIDNGGRTRSPVARASARILRERVRAALSGEEASDVTRLTIAQRTELARKRVCPECRQGVGHPCRSGKGRSGYTGAQMKTVHASRLALAPKEVISDGT